MKDISIKHLGITLVYPRDPDISIKHLGITLVYPRDPSPAGRTGTTATREGQHLRRTFATAEGTGGQEPASLEWAEAAAGWCASPCERCVSGKIQQLLHPLLFFSSSYSPSPPVCIRCDQLCSSEHPLTGCVDLIDLIEWRRQCFNTESLSVLFRECSLDNIMHFLKCTNLFNKLWWHYCTP